MNIKIFANHVAYLKTVSYDVKIVLTANQKSM